MRSRPVQLGVHCASWNRRAGTKGARLRVEMPVARPSVRA